MSGTPPLRLRLRASLVLTLLTLAAHAAAALTLLALLPLAEGLCAAGLLVALGAIALWERTLLRSARAVFALEVGGEGGLAVWLRDGRRICAISINRRYVSRWMVVLELARHSALRRTILLSRDMLPAEDFRQLRLWALWNALPAAHASSARTISPDACL